MGIYDRDYYRQGRSGLRLSAPRTAVGAIILINIAVFAVEIVNPVVVETSPDVVTDFLSNHVVVDSPQDRSWWEQDTLRHPWLWWQWLTCGFVHDPHDPGHIIGNMLVLFFLGRAVEAWYGTREFIRLYLVTLVFSSVVWAVATRLFEPQLNALHPFASFGASGAIAGVVTLFALNFPKQILLLFFVLPVPAWLVGAGEIVWDIYGATGRTGQHVAFTAHLGGAALALAYFTLHWNFGRMWEPAAAWLKGRRRPSLKVFKPEDDPHAHTADEDVDRILEKIHREGEGSLTRNERRILENASREYQRRRQGE